MSRIEIPVALTSCDDDRITLPLYPFVLLYLAKHSQTFDERMTNPSSSSFERYPKWRRKSYEKLMNGDRSQVWIWSDVDCCWWWGYGCHQVCFSSSLSWRWIVRADCLRVKYAPISNLSVVPLLSCTVCLPPSVSRSQWSARCFVIVWEMMICRQNYDDEYNHMDLILSREISLWLLLLPWNQCWYLIKTKIKSWF